MGQNENISSFILCRLDIHCLHFSNAMINVWVNIGKQNMEQLRLGLKTSKREQIKVGRAPKCQAALCSLIL